MKSLIRTKYPLTSPVYQLARGTNLFAVFVITVIYEKSTTKISSY